MKKLISINVAPARYKDDDPIINIQQLVALDLRGVAALSMIERWGIVAADEDGEDSTGRSKHKLATEEMVVHRAIKMAQLAFDKFEELGWTEEIPSMAEAEIMFNKKALGD